MRRERREGTRYGRGFIKLFICQTISFYVFFDNLYSHIKNSKGVHVHAHAHIQTQFLGREFFDDFTYRRSRVL